MLYREVEQKIKDHNTQLEEKANYLKRNSLQKLLETSNTNIVISGDSLSFNRYDFTTDTDSDAYLHYPGLMSWSFMLRDTIHKNDKYFKTIEEIDFNSNKQTLTYNGGSKDYVFPMNGIYLAVNSKDGTSYLSFKYKTSKVTKDIVLYLFENSGATACTFDVQINGTTIKNVSTKLDSGEYKGFKPFQIVINSDSYNLGDEVEIKIFNIVAIAGSESNIYLQGIGTINRNIYLTGHGGWKSSDILSDVQNRILKYVPDFLVFICGANDIYYNVGAENYKANIDNILNQARVLKPNCEILLLTSTLMDGFEEQTKLYNKALYELSLKYNTYFLDLVELFKNTNKPLWRFDNVHLTKYGNTLLCKEILELIMPSGFYEKKLVESALYFRGNSRCTKPSNNNKSYLISWNGTTFDKTGLLGSDASNIVSITKVNASKIGVTFSTYLDKIPRIEQYGNVNTFMLVHTMVTSKNYVEFNIFKCVGGIFTSIVDSDWTGNINFSITT